MTKKQIRKLAKELTELERIHQNSSSSDEKMRAEKRIIQITNQLAALPDGLSILMTIDNLIQENFEKKEN